LTVKLQRTGDEALSYDIMHPVDIDEPFKWTLRLEEGVSRVDLGRGRWFPGCKRVTALKDADMRQRRSGVRVLRVSVGNLAETMSASTTVIELPVLAA
jgi:hypothetical protein